MNDAFIFSGLILYECIHPTATDEAQLYLILKNIRSRQFPATFKESKSENILIKKMLSPSRDNRPSANDVLKTIKGFLEPELPGKCVESMKENTIKMIINIRY